MQRVRIKVSGTTADSKYVSISSGDKTKYFENTTYEESTEVTMLIASTTNSPTAKSSPLTLDPSYSASQQLLLSQPPGGPVSLPTDYEDVEFETVGEGWNEYDLSDGVRLKGRIILARIRRDPSNPGVLDFEITPPAWSVCAQVASRGRPTGELLRDSPKLDAHDRSDMHINKNHEPWNIYRMPGTGQELRIKLITHEVQRMTDAFDVHGCPVYRVSHGISIVVKDDKPGHGS